jgi:hypothetical protein
VEALVSQRRKAAASEPRVVVPHNRCPFCHVAVDVEATDWVACRRCLARHHRDCRREAMACGSCGDAGPALTLAPIEPAAGSRSLPRRHTRARESRHRWIARGAMALAAVVGLALVLAQPRRSYATVRVAPVAIPHEPAPDYVIEHLDFLESEGLLRTAYGKTQEALQDYPGDPELPQRLDDLRELMR